MGHGRGGHLLVETEADEGAEPELESETAAAAATISVPSEGSTEPAEQAEPTVEQDT